MNAEPGVRLFGHGSEGVGREPPRSLPRFPFDGRVYPVREKAL